MYCEGVRGHVLLLLFVNEMYDKNGVVSVNIAFKVLFPAVPSSHATNKRYAGTGLTQMKEKRTNCDYGNIIISHCMRYLSCFRFYSSGIPYTLTCTLQIFSTSLSILLSNVSFIRSSCVLLLDDVTFDVLLKVDDVTSLDISSDSRVRKQFF